MREKKKLSGNKKKKRGKKEKKTNRNGKEEERIEGRREWKERNME